MLDVKGEEVPAAAQDVVLGEMLEVHATPEEERKVLRKLDLVYASMCACCLDGPELTSQIDAHDGCLLHAA